MYLSHSFQDPDRNSARVTFQNDSKLDFEGAFFVHEMLLILCLKYISHFITFSVSVPTRMATFRIMLENHRNSLVTVSVGSRFIIKLEQLCFLQMVCLSLVTILNCYWAINWEQQNCVLLFSSPEELLLSHNTTDSHGDESRGFCTNITRKEALELCT